jgi:hypothetical protein
MLIRTISAAPAGHFFHRAWHWMLYRIILFACRIKRFFNMLLVGCKIGIEWLRLCSLCFADVYG